MAVDNPRILRRDRDVGEQAGDQAGPHCRPADRADDGFRAIDHVIHEVAGFFPNPRSRVEIIHHLPDHLEVAARRESRAGTGQNGRRNAVIRVDIAPDGGKLPMHAFVGGIQSRRIVHDDAQDARMRPFELQTLIAPIIWSHGESLFLHFCLSTNRRVRPLPLADSGRLQPAIQDTRSRARCTVSRLRTKSTDGSRGHDRF